MCRTAERKGKNAESPGFRHPAGVRYPEGPFAGMIFGVRPENSGKEYTTIFTVC